MRHTPSCEATKNIFSPSSLKLKLRQTTKFDHIRLILVTSTSLRSQIWWYGYMWYNPNVELGQTFLICVVKGQDFITIG